MTHLVVLVLAVLIGAVAGLRSLTAPMAVAWAAALHWINMDGTWASWLAHPVTVGVLTALAAAELVADVLARTPDRTVPVQFVARIVAGGFAGAVIGTAWGFGWSALGAGMIGAVLGTLGGLRARTALAGPDRRRDLPAAVAESSVALIGGFVIAALTSVA